MQPKPAAEAFATVLHESCLGVRVARLHRYTARRFDRELRDLGMTMPQLEILSLLVLRKTPMRPGEIADVLLAERSTVSRGLAVLDRNGWTAPTDTSPTGRSMTVTITPKGADVLASAHAAWQRAQDDIAEALGQRAQTVLDDWITKLLDPPTPTEQVAPAGGWGTAS